MEQDIINTDTDVNQPNTTSTTFDINHQNVRTIALLSYLNVTFEWYDFFLYAVLSSVIAKQFTPGLNDSWSFIFSLITFSVGLVFRPVGGFIFGFLGDKYGRKMSLLINILLMSVPTFMVSVLPTYESIGITAPIILFFLRILQGIALGGGWAGISIYVAETSPYKKRAQYVGNLSAFTVLGLIIATSLTYLLKDLFGEAEFNEWAWRLPFLASTIFLSLSVWIRLKLKESNTFTILTEQKKISKELLKDTFFYKDNLKRMARAILLLPIMQALYYLAYTYSLGFLIQVLKINERLATEIFLYAACGSFPMYFIASSFMNHKYKKNTYLILGCLFSLSLYPLFNLISQSGNSNLMKFNERNIVLKVNQDKCDSQFNPLNTALFTKSCDVAKNVLSRSSLNYRIEHANNTESIISIDKKEFVIRDITSKTLTENREDLTKIQKDFINFIKNDGYELNNNTHSKKFSYFGVLFGVWSLMSCAAILFMLANSFCVELFMAKNRVLSYSFSYNLVAIVGGLTTPISFALVSNMGNMFAGILFISGFGISIAILGAIFLRTKNKQTEFKEIDWEGFD